MLLITAQSQACLVLDGKVDQPHEFVGRWARLVADTVWSDTIELAADGRARGSLDHSMPDSTRWAVVHSRFGEGFCLGPRGKRNCQPFRLEGDTLVLGTMPKQSTGVGRASASRSPPRCAGVTFHPLPAAG